ncbi:hypothetical protein HJC23_004877 [Cyclotella cryptica]|uniref:Uncharacterized protein n=1 Tax=Cyclotella cryptica TaxID=29204 RepID=A0ABD3P747_9STRA
MRARATCPFTFLRTYQLPDVTSTNRCETTRILMNDDDENQQLQEREL